MRKTEIHSVRPLTSVSGADAPAVTIDGGYTLVSVVKESTDAVTLSTKLDGISSSSGMQLPTDQPVRFLAGPGTRLYFYSTSTSARVSVITQPIDGILELLVQGISAAMQGLVPVPQDVVKHLQRPATPGNKLGWEPPVRR